MMTARNQDARGPRLATTARLLAAVVFLAMSGGAIARTVGVQDGESGSEGAAPAPASEPGSESEEPVSPQVIASREALDSGEEDVPVLAIHATRLLDAGDVESLERVLSGPHRAAVLGILQALQTVSSVALLSETIQLASTSEDAEVSQLALDNLVRLVRDRPEVAERLIERLGDAGLTVASRNTMVEVLGRSRNLAAVEPLIGLLGSSQEPAAGLALEELTGHAFGTDIVAWSEFWRREHGEPRDVLLERSLAAERIARRETEQQLRQEVVQSRIRRMGMDVDRLVAGLSNGYAAVRLASARQLGSHPNGEQAATAIPAMLARLGYGSQVNGHGNGTGNGHGNTHGVGDETGLQSGGSVAKGAHVAGAENGSKADHGSAAGNGTDAGNGLAVVLEEDAQVRAALVAAVGVLGRGKPVVLDVLLQELRSEDVETAAVAAAAFVRLRDHPAVVEPLLGYLERGAVGETTLVTVLRVVANNEPAGVLDRLTEWLGDAHSPTVRAAAVAAVLASADLTRALDAVDDVATNEDIRDVRYALAKALGDRARGLPADDGARPLVLELLGLLLDDVDSSVRAEAASSLGEAGGPEAFAQLDRRSRAEVDASVMMRIVHALGQMGDREGVGAIGRVCASWSGEGRAELDDAAHRALLVLGDGVSADGWLEMAGTLKEVGSPALSAWSLREILLRHEGDPGSRDVVSLARGHLAEVLCLVGQSSEAYQMLVELHEAGAPYPGLRLRLELLARTAEELGLVDEAADYYLERLDELAEGDATRLDTQSGAVRTLMAAGRYEEALPLARELYEQDASDNGTMYRLARIQAALGRDRAAVDTLRRLLPRIPVEGDALRTEVQALLAQIEATLPAPEPVVVPVVAPAPASAGAADGASEGAITSGEDPGSSTAPGDEATPAPTGEPEDPEGGATPADTEPGGETDTDPTPSGQGDVETPDDDGTTPDDTDEDTIDR